MPALLEFTVAGASFGLGRALGRFEGATIDLTQFVPTGDHLVPYLWADVDDADAFAAAVRDDDGVAAIEPVDTATSRSLFRVEWLDRADELLSIVHRHQLLVERATCSDGRWTFRVWADDGGALGDFQEDCRAADLGLTIERVARTDHPDVRQFGLTAKQRDTLLAAVDAGYFDRDAGVSLADVGEQLGVSRQAVSDRLNRGIANLVGNTIG